MTKGRGVIPATPVPGNVGRARGNSNIQSSPEEKAMKDTYNLSEIRSFWRALQIVALIRFLAATSRAVVRFVHRLLSAGRKLGAQTLSTRLPRPRSPQIVGGVTLL